MTKRFSAVIALVCCLATRSHAQSAPKAPPCDPAGQLAKSPEIYGARRATLNTTCGSYQILLQRFADSTWTGKQLLAYLLHSTPPFPAPPPVDTTVVTPPVVVPPKDSTPKPPPVIPPPVDNGSTITLANVNPMGPLTAKTVTVPKGSAGRSIVDIKPGGCGKPPACHAGEGAVRILTNLAFMAFEDPIVYFGQPGKSHLHQFFGQSHVTAFTTADSLLSNCSSTNSGGAANCTAYWTPALIDANGLVVAPVDYPNGTTIYYKSGLAMDPKLVQPLPTGLKMIEGDKTWSNTKQNQQHVWWTCADSPGPSFSSTIPDCVGRLELIVVFPQCWNGRDLDSPDHKSHMAHPNFINIGGGRSTCSATHPVVVPEITELFFWPVPKGVKSSTWHISSDMDLTKPGGLSAHADWFMGWRPEIMAQLVTCLNASIDVGTNGLCNSTYLNPPPL